MLINTEHISTYLNLIIDRPIHQLNSLVLCMYLCMHVFRKTIELCQSALHIWKHVIHKLRWVYLKHVHMKRRRWSSNNSFWSYLLLFCCQDARNLIISLLFNKLVTHIRCTYMHRKFFGSTKHGCIIPPGFYSILSTT